MKSLTLHFVWDCDPGGPALPLSSHGFPRVQILLECCSWCATYTRVEGQAVRVSSFREDRLLFTCSEGIFVDQEAGEARNYFWLLALK